MYMQTLGALNPNQAALQQFENALDQANNDLGAAIRLAGEAALVAYLVDQDRSPVEYAAMLTAATGRGYSVNDVLMLYRNNGYEEYLQETADRYASDISSYLYGGEYPKKIYEVGEIVYSPAEEAEVRARMAANQSTADVERVYTPPTVIQTAVTPEIFEENQGAGVPIIAADGSVEVQEFTQKELEKMALDARYAFFSVELVENKTPEEKAAYFNFLRSQGFTEAGIFEAIEYWMGPQRPEDLQALKTLAEQLRTADGPILTDARDFPRSTGPDTGPGSPLREPVFGQAAGGGNTGLLIAAALAALTLLG